MNDFPYFQKQLLNGNTNGVRSCLNNEFMNKIVDDWKYPIHVACEKGFIDIVKLLLEHKCNIECENRWRKRPIHYGCMNGHIDIVKLLLKHKCNIECEEGIKGMRPIHHGCMNGHIDIVKLLLEHKCNIECEDKSGWRPIHWGCRNRHIGIVKLLLEHKCNIECETEGGWRPIHWGCRNGHIGIVQLLINNKCGIHCKDENGKTPFDLATENNNKACMDLINKFIQIEKFFASIKENDVIEFDKLYNSHNLATREHDTGLSVLDVALQNSADKIIKYFIEKPVDDAEIFDLTKALKDIKNVETAHLIKECILYRCIIHHHAEGFKKFNTADVINGHLRIVSSSFLEIAAEHGCGAFINEIMKKTIYEKETWDKAKNKAKQNGFEQIEEEISDRKILLESRRKVNFSILHTAICDNDVDMVKYILDNPNLIDPNSNNEIFGTAMALAHSLHHRKCINILEQYQVDPNTQNKFLQTPLHEAIASGMHDNCKYLIDRALDIDKTGFMGLTGLHCAVIRGLIDICSQLVNKGADCVRYIEFTHQSSLTDTAIPNIKSILPLSNSENALTLAMKIHGTLFSCFLDILDANKSNACDGENNSLLHMAVKCLQPDICRSLLSAGAVVDKVNSDGNTSLLELLCNIDNQFINDNMEKMIEIVKILIEYGTDINMRSFTGKSVFQSASNYQSENLMVALVAKSPELNSLSENDFQLAFSNQWFDYAEILLKFLPAKFLLSNITNEIFQLCMKSESKLIKLLFEKSNTHLQQSIVEDLLYQAAINDDDDLFDHLINTEILSPKLFGNGEHLLTILLKENKISFGKKLLKSKSKMEYVNMKNRKNQIPLQIAIEIEEMSLIDILIHESDDFNCEDVSGKTPLTQLLEKISICNDGSLQARLLSAIKSIIPLGGDIYTTTSHGQRVIDACTQNYVKDDIELFFKRTKDRLGTQNMVKVEEKICGICLNNPVNCTFQCGHLFCNECADNVFSCPVCKADITSRIRIYLN